MFLKMVGEFGPWVYQREGPISDNLLPIIFSPFFTAFYDSSRELLDPQQRTLNPGEGDVVNPLLHMVMLGSSNSAANKDMMS